VKPSVTKSASLLQFSGVRCSVRPLSYSNSDEEDILVMMVHIIY